MNTEFYNNKLIEIDEELPLLEDELARVESVAGNRVIGINAIKYRITHLQKLRASIIEKFEKQENRGRNWRSLYEGKLAEVKETEMRISDLRGRIDTLMQTSDISGANLKNSNALSKLSRELRGEMLYLARMKANVTKHLMRKPSNLRLDTSNALRTEFVTERIVKEDKCTNDDLVKKALDQFLIDVENQNKKKRSKYAVNTASSEMITPQIDVDENSSEPKLNEFGEWE